MVGDISGSERSGGSTGARPEATSTPFTQAFTDLADCSHEDNTMVRIISALILAVASTFCVAAEPPLQLAPNAPERHIVIPGDTLWGISSRFLKEPWRWPEIWRMNKEQIKNPHRIYPGDVVILDSDQDGNPLLRVQSVKLQPKIYSESVSEAIPAIPPNVIEPFISAPLVVDAEGLNKAARIVATQQDRVYLGKGDLAYVENADASKELWQIFRNGKPLRDPADNNLIIGYEAFYLGTAKQIRPGNPATFEILSSKEEIGRGDRLIPSVRPPLIDYVPHKPDFPIDGRIMSIYGVPVYGGIGTAGHGSVVSLNRGSRDGLEIGHVLALERNRIAVQRDENDRKVNVQIPPERTGLVFIFRTFERISYALVVQSEGVVEVNDFVRTP
ncbi:MAG: LysM peptidoglycan-binding domain-containing protein [Betaproteobacteria bacterium]